MYKAVICGLALVFSSSVFAVPITWNVSSDILSGQFTYDAGTNTYSDMDIWAIAESPDPNRFDLKDLFIEDDPLNLFVGTPLGFVAYDEVHDAQLTLSLLGPMTDLGGMIAFTGVILDGLGGNTYFPTGTISSYSVSEPASIVLLSLALLGWARIRARS